jgi:hypothetical protein
MMRGGNGNSQFDKTMEYLDSLGYAVNSLCQIAQMVETNAEGIVRFGFSMVRLIGRIKEWNKSLFFWMVNFILSLPAKFKRIWYFIMRKTPPDEPQGD